MIDKFKDKLFFERIERKWTFDKDTVSLNSLNINILRSKLKSFLDFKNYQEI